MRKHACWINAFEDFTAATGSPNIFRRWAAIATIAGALERKVWIKTGKGVLYPNLYTILVGPPGAGKTLATAISYDLMKEIPKLKLAPTNVSRASLMDTLHESERREFIKGNIISFNSMTVISDELGVLIPAYDSDFMNVLTNIYDCRVYHEKKRTKSIDLEMPNPQLNLIAATTPSFLNNLLPEGAWDQGFLSRTLLIFSGESSPSSLWDEANEGSAAFKKLVHDLKLISDLYGKLTFDPDAAHAINEWHLAGGPPAPDHPKLLHYTTRRTAHLLKLCQIACAASSDEPVITLDHYKKALGWLLEAEAMMADIFKSMRSGGDSRIIMDVWHYAYHVYVKSGKAVPEHEMIGVLQEKAPAYAVGRILEVMVKSKILEERMEPKIGKVYIPRPLKAGR